MKHAHGHHNEQTIYRAGKIIGSVGKSLDEIFQLKITEADVKEEYTKRTSFKKEIEKFCTQYSEDRLFDNIPGRHHKSFPVFELEYVKVPGPVDFKRRLFGYRKKLDAYRSVLE